jgi:hypothetical protein
MDNTLELNEKLNPPLSGMLYATNHLIDAENDNSKRNAMMPGSKHRFFLSLPFI